MEHKRLNEIQKYVAEKVNERGFGDETIKDKLMLIMEECGEMAKAIRKTTGIKSDPNSTKYHPDLEVADVFFYLLDICNKLNIDLEESFWKKEEINNKRSWE